MCLKHGVKPSVIPVAYKSVMDKAKLAQLRSVIVNVGDALVITSLGADTGAFTVCFSSS